MTRIDIRTLMETFSKAKDPIDLPAATFTGEAVKLVVERLPTEIVLVLPETPEIKGTRWDARSRLDDYEGFLSHHIRFFVRAGATPYRASLVRAGGAADAVRRARKTPCSATSTTFPDEDWTVISMFADLIETTISGLYGLPNGVGLPASWKVMCRRGTVRVDDKPTNALVQASKAVLEQEIEHIERFKLTFHGVTAAEG